MPAAFLNLLLLFLHVASTVSCQKIGLGRKTIDLLYHALMPLVKMNSIASCGSSSSAPYLRGDASMPRKVFCPLQEATRSEVRA